MCYEEKKYPRKPALCAVPSMQSALKWSNTTESNLLSVDSLCVVVAVVAVLYYFGCQLSDFTFAVGKR